MTYDGRLTAGHGAEWGFHGTGVGAGGAATCTVG